MRAQEDIMKEALNRLLIAVALALFQMVACGPVHTQPRSIFTYFGTFIFLTAVWSVPLQGHIVVRDVIRRYRTIENAPTKELPVPETQPLDKPQ